MDHSGESGDLLQSEVRIRRGRHAARYHDRGRRVASRRCRKSLAGIRPFWRDFPARNWKERVFRHPFLDRDSLGMLGDHVTLEARNRRGSHGAGPWPGRFCRRPAIRASGLLPGGCAGRMFRAEGASGELPDELIGKTVWEANPHRHQAAGGTWRAGCAAQSRTQLSALLALPQPGDLPRHGAVVHRHGPRGTAQPTRWKRSRA